MVVRLSKVLRRLLRKHENFSILRDELGFMPQDVVPDASGSDGPAYVDPQAGVVGAIDKN